MAHLKGPELPNITGYATSRKNHDEGDLPDIHIDRLTVTPEIKSPITIGEYACQLGLDSRRLKVVVHPNKPDSFQLSLNINPNKLKQVNLELLSEFIQGRNKVGMLTTCATDDESNPWINFDFDPKSADTDSIPSLVDINTILLKLQVRRMYEYIQMVEDGIAPSVPTPWIHLRPHFSTNFDFN